MSTSSNYILKGSIIEADMAWNSNVRPNKILFKHKVPEDISFVILSSIQKIFPEIKEEGKISLASLKPVIDCAGHFCLYCGEKKWFLRITRRRRKDNDIEDAVAFYLSNAGIKVNLPFISDSLILWKDHSYLLYIYSLFEGRHYDGSDKDLRNISRVVKHMHRALKSFKFANKVFKNALRTAKRLSDIKTKITHSLQKKDLSLFYERVDWARRNYYWLKAMADCFNPYLCLLPKSQCVHGELHLGNVMFSLRDNSVMLTDFEETSDAWFPPSFDLAYLVHRFCMEGVQSKSIFRRRLDILENTYGILPNDLREMLHQVCWYNIALLIERSARRESTSPEEEYDKFVRLESITDCLFP